MSKDSRGSNVVGSLSIVPVWKFSGWRVKDEPKESDVSETAMTSIAIHDDLLLTSWQSYFLDFGYVHHLFRKSVTLQPCMKEMLLTRRGRLKLGDQNLMI